MLVLATYRFRADEYHRLGEAGILEEDDRVELLNGDLVVEIFSDITFPVSAILSS